MSFHHQPRIVTDSMVLYHDAKNPKSYPGAGSIFNDLKNGYDLTVDASWNPIGYFELPGGTYNRMTPTPLSLQGNPSFTVFGAFKRNAEYLGGATWGIGGDTSYQGFNSYSTISNKISLDLWGSTTMHCGQDYPLDEWVLVHWIKTTGLYDSSSLTIYVNDTPYTGNNLIIIRQGVSLPNINANGVVWGRAGANTNLYYATVDIALLAMYNKTLTHSEVLQNYNSLKSRFGL